MKVWIVDGRLVRDMYKTDFVLGGHGYVYSWIPNNEIWIDDQTDEVDIPFVLIHEITELKLMKEGIKYTVAHNKASQTEYAARHQAVAV